MGESLSTTEWKRVIRAIDAPVAVASSDGSLGVTVLAVSARFRELCSSIGKTVEELIASLDPAGFAITQRFPGQDDWQLHARELEDGRVWLWEAAAMPPETAFDHLVRWTASATLGDLGVYLFDRDWRLRAYNGAIRRYFPEKPGFPVIGGTLEDQMTAIFDTYDMGNEAAEFREAWRSDVGAALREPGAARLGLTPSGRWALITASRMEDGSHLAFMNDVTEFRQRDQQLKLFMRNAQGILFSRRELKPGGKLQVWGDMRGLSQSEPVKGNSREHPAGWYDLIDPRDRERYMTFMEAIKPGDKPYAMEFRYRLPGADRTRWMREIGWTVRDRGGRDFLDAIYFDISANKDAHQALEASEERFRQFADLASDWYFETDGDLRVTFVSDRYEQTSGTSNEILMNTPYEDVVAMRTRGLPEELAAHWHDILDKWRRRESVREHRLRFFNEGGRMVTVSVSSEPRFDDDGAFLGYRGIGRDLTALTEAQYRALESLERAEKASAAKSAFIANVSHELRTPLNAIIGFSSIMKDEVLGAVGNDRYRQYSADINASGTHLLSLVNDLLDMSKLEAGRLSVNDEVIDIAKETAQVIQILSSQSGKRRMTMAFPDSLPALLADARAFRQVLINLIGNAIKFTDAEGNIEISASHEPGSGISISISDDGVGIDGDQIEEIFEPFGRAKSDIAAEGTGLGLPLSRNLMRLHGGDLEITSERGRGTHARMIFPESRVAEPGADARSATA
ncbi:MAG: ATP-binding protein [Minwuia sp.]|uniref:PAS domain-containing sensor histidine kinase n=1 Tax=Minwuia sp. TaxID=2493630 RepID=UPI003A84B217